MRLGPVRPGQAALLVIAGVALVEGISVAIAGLDLHLTGVLALLIGGLLYTAALIPRLLGPAPEIRTLLAVVGTLLAGGGMGTITDGIPAPLRVALGGAAILVLAAAAAVRIPSAVAAGLAALAIIAGPSLVIAAAGGSGVLAAALAGALALVLVILGVRSPWRLGHPGAGVWVTGTAALVGAPVVGVLAQLVGGVAIAAAVVAAVGLVIAAQRRCSVVLGFAAFAVIAAAVSAVATLATGGGAKSVAAVLIVLGVVLAAAAVVGGAFSSGQLAIRGAAALPLRIEELVIALAAVLTLVAATGTPGGGFGGRTPFSPFGSSSGSGSGSGSGTFTFQPGPTDSNGLPCPSPSPDVASPSGCP